MPRLDKYCAVSALALAITACLMLSQIGSAQGLLVDTRSGHHVRLPRPHIIHPPYPYPHPQPIPASRYKIESLDVDVKLSDQLASVQVSQSFVNTGSQQMEVCFVFPLPYDGAIDRLTLMIDGKEYDAQLLPAEEARRLYESIVRKNQDPALLEWIGTGMFKTSVFPVPPGAKRTVKIRYSQICRKFEGMTDFLFPLSTAKYTSDAVEHLKIHLVIDSKTPIKNVYCPSHSVDIQRPVDSQAIVSFAMEKQIPTSDFRLFYDVGKEQLATSVISYRPDPGQDGYFLLLASPPIQADSAERPKKNVIFVMDRSGSMSGQKIEQAKGALKFVLNNLREGDLFNIIAYDSEIESYRPEIQRFNEETRLSALGFIEGLYAGGSTNIDGALQRAMSMLTDSSRPNYIIFLTDGLPTAGEMGETKIDANAKNANRVRARLFAFGVGYDVNSRLLDRLVRSNHGQSEYVRPNEDIEAAVSKFYQRIGAPVLTNVAIQVDVEGARVEQGTPINRVYPKETLDLFAGEQLVLVGRYKVSGSAKVVITGTMGDKEQRFDFPANLAAESGDSTNAFVAKLWATRRVGEIIDQLDLEGRNEELIKELVTLATEHGILTPYTTFLADETSNLHDMAFNTRHAGELALRQLSETDGLGAFMGRAGKGYLQRADQPNRAPAATVTPAGGMPSEGGLGSGAYYGRAAGPALVGDAAQTYDLERGENVAIQTVQMIGKKTFFFRGGRWVDSKLTEEEEKNANKITRFSDDYFELVRQHGREIGQYYALDEPVVVKIGDKVYEW
ncbi:MAG: VWA domain-containing protein [Pirellulales bacterium]|nr:VWA domain-containing protein [Pirellulales bacterium]